VSRAERGEQLAVSADDTPQDRQPPAARVEVLGGGEATPEQLAALVVALTPASGTDEPGEGRPTLPAWTAAALREGVGRAQVLAPADLHGFDPHR
jgi:hypothetical protein